LFILVEYKRIADVHGCFVFIAYVLGIAQLLM
jgi:hypothetical protein